ncbi:hypothetical protein [Fusobacterium sp.]|uniref:hypothetical protein n=1 Tax=Fusobacterium sp. TaxID=68766 RepID=UPI002E781DEB|nr:hypothetical protein [Fusobacterium sp.]MEE1475422.1 hypothetical protein [Fusobacterium sp.]
MDNEIEVITDADEDSSNKKVIEQTIYVPELENGLVRMDMNIIEYPLFTKNRRIKPNVRVRFVINDNRNKTIEIIPAADEVVPGEFEKAVFIALSKIIKQNGYKNTFVTTASEILNNMEVSIASQRSLYKKVRVALERLGKTSYVFNNTLYSSKEKNLINSKIITKILEVQIITKVSKNDIEKYSEMSEERRNFQEEYFKDSRLKEVFVISFGNYFYQNIMSKGYLVYSSSQLLGLRSNGMALDLYMLITKARMYNLVYKENFLKLAGRIGIKLYKKNYLRNKKSLEEAAKVLLEKKLIENYKFVKEGTWNTAYFEFYFTEEHNKIKQNNFMEDKNAFGEIVISQHDELEEARIKKSEILKKHKVSEGEIEYAISKLPYNLRRLKTISYLIKDAIATYGLKRILQAIEYTKINAKTKPKSFLDKAIEFNYGSKIEVELPKQIVLDQLGAAKEEKSKPISTEVAFNKFMELDEKKQLSIMKKAIEDSIETTLQFSGKVNDDMKENIRLGIESNFRKEPNKYLAQWLVDKKFFEKKKDETSGEESKMDFLMKKLESKKKEVKITTDDIQQALFSTKQLSNEEAVKEVFKEPLKEKKVEEIIEIPLEEKEVKSEPVKVEVIEESLDDYVEIKEVKTYINNAIALYADLLDLDEEAMNNIKKDIAKVILPLAMRNKLTRKKLEELIQIELDKL